MPSCGKISNQHSEPDLLHSSRNICFSACKHSLLPFQQSDLLSSNELFTHYTPSTSPSPSTLTSPSSTYLLYPILDEKMSSHHHHPLTALSTAKNPVHEYDLTPFLSSPTITSLLPGEQPVVIQIPETLVASPLAANHAPATLLEIKELLTGETFPWAGSGKGRGGGVRGG